MAREMAEAIPDAQFVELDGLDHFAHIGDVDQWIDAIEAFVIGVDVASPPRRVSLRPTVEIRTFGGFGVARDGSTCRWRLWGSRRAAACANGSLPPVANPLHAMSCPSCCGPTTRIRPDSAPDSPFNSPWCDGSSAEASSPIATQSDSISTRSLWTLPNSGPSSKPCRRGHRHPSWPVPARGHVRAWADAPRNRSRASYLAALATLAAQAAIATTTHGDRSRRTPHRSRSIRHPRTDD